jgi:hypothetical protein
MEGPVTSYSVRRLEFGWSSNQRGSELCLPPTDTPATIRSLDAGELLPQLETFEMIAGLSTKRSRLLSMNRQQAIPAAFLEFPVARKACCKKGF